MWSCFGCDARWGPGWGGLATALRLWALLVDRMEPEDMDRSLIRAAGLVIAQLRAASRPTAPFRCNPPAQGREGLGDGRAPTSWCFSSRSAHALSASSRGS